MSAPRVALAGATGNLGRPILSALLSAGYPVTVLTRTGSTSSKPTSHANLTIESVDFTSVASLTPALRGIQVVVCCFATSALDSQNPLIDAAVAAGVTHFIPADFGMDTQNPLAVQLPIGKIKAENHEYLREQTKAHPGFSWTAIANGWFLDWVLEMGLIVDLTKHTATLYNGGDVVFSATTLADIAKAVIGVIENQGEIANRVIYVHSATVTQNQLIQYAKDKDGKEWKTVEKSTEAVRKESYDELEKGDGADVEAATLGFCIVALFDKEYGCDFSERLANDVVCVKEMTEQGVREVVERLL
ncbi:oxidoreductase CipA-like protein [Ophiobolus disseminans]|uniref:Oxidoreductase CipA-like protein n=1 Tax=Ophiobolus disseminans TaxID=1469910 RepID=A0A6A6ZZ81_9PLEO|nr:oxidoreductase CipA-like protein [Ophiobolus disseminans]